MVAVNPLLQYRGEQEVEQQQPNPDNEGATQQPPGGTGGLIGFFLGTGSFPARHLIIICGNPHNRQFV
jgi:hypothetical protein